jgi:uncharacterized protein YecE (DUF72 family)
VPQTITHQKVMLDCSAEVEEFAAEVRLLGNKLLCCVLQFGYFNRAAFASADEFLSRLDSFLGSTWPKDIAVAVEIRNKAGSGDPSYQPFETEFLMLTSSSSVRASTASVGVPTLAG